MRQNIGRFFKERQIYHRSDGIVRFIKLSPQTQVALAAIVLFALCWVAYASVNVVFKEQIILAAERDRQAMEADYRRRQTNLEKSYDDVNALNVIFGEEFEAAFNQLESRHETLSLIVQNKRAVDDGFDSLAETLAAAGAPGGRQLKNANRVMVDPVGREPTPRQSRESRIREKALQEVLRGKDTAGVQDPILTNIREKTATLSSRQVVLMAQVEAEIQEKMRKLDAVLSHTGVETDLAAAHTRISNSPLVLASAEGDDENFDGQGGPAISEFNPTGEPSVYFQSASRIQTSIEELMVMSELLRTIPLSSPLLSPHRVSSGYGFRSDPFTRKRTRHFGLDFAARRRTPVVTTAPGKVSFAGVRGGFGNTVEVDHGNGFMTRYAHLNRINVRAGQKVKLHDVIGLLGSTGRSSGPHVHYEIHYKSRQIDPLHFIEAGRYVFES